MEYGFVYIWRDRKHKRYYIGCHWGQEDDGYICSSPWMKQAYKRRPNDFRRRILSRVYTTRKDLFDEEIYWHSLIKDEELKVKYYNLHKAKLHWSADPDKHLSVREKISKNVKKFWEENPEKKKEHGTKLSNSLKEYWKTNPTEHINAIKKAQSGKIVSNETIEKQSSKTRGQKRTNEQRKRISESLKGRKFSEEHIKSLRGRTSPNKGKFGKAHHRYGTKHSSNTIEKIRKANKDNMPDLSGTIWINNGMKNKRVTKDVYQSKFTDWELGRK